MSTETAVGLECHKHRTEHVTNPRVTGGPDKQGGGPEQFYS